MNCPTEAQVVALLGSKSTRELHEYAQWCGESPFWLVIYAVRDGEFTWSDLFRYPEQTLAIAFDNWQDEFRDILDETDEP